jgi:voltage-gated potassium channel
MSAGEGRGLFGMALAPPNERIDDEPEPLGSDWARVLADVPLLAGLSKRHLRKVARAGRRTCLPSLTTIISPTRRNDAFYVILDGRAAVTTVTGERVDLGPGQFFGELALLDPAPGTATVSAETDLTCMRISQGRFLELLESEPTIAVKLLQAMAARVRGLEREHV